MNPKFELFVVYHKELNKDYYRDDLLSNYTFINVNPGNKPLPGNAFPKYINQYELKKFRPLGKWYTESEVIYNIYLNPEMYDKLDYIGFLQYDIDSSPLNFETLSECLRNNDHINFEPHSFQTDYNQNILMDLNQPNKITGKGLNCYDVILTDYNNYYRTKHSLAEISGQTLNLCSAFILKKDLFISMMKFVSYIIEKGNLEKYDTKHQYRIQGGYLERYYAVWIALNQLRTKEIKLKHYFAETIVQNTLLKRILKKLKLN